MGLSLFMKKSGVVLFLAILLLGFFIAQQVTKTEVRISANVVDEIEKGNDVRVYVNLKESGLEGKGIASDTKQELKDSIDVKHEFEDKVTAIISEAELDELKNNPNVESIEIVGTRNIHLQDSVGQINANETWTSQLKGINLTGVGETICVIDTGVNYNHADLGGCFGSGCKVIGGFDYCADNVNCTTSDSDPMDESSGIGASHGTHVSGIIAANGNLKGVAPEANLVVIKASNATGTFWDDDIEKAIEWCVNNASTYNISVISMSLGGGLYTNHCNNDPLNTSINNAVANDISVVIAAGNDGSTTQISAPACLESATPIASIRKDDSTFNYNRNALVLLAAPGYDINSTIISGYGTKSGTSMATPHVSAAIALVNQFRKLEGNNIYSPSENEDKLNDSGKRIFDSGSSVTYSRIDILQTLKDIDSSAPEITINSPSHNSLSVNNNQTFNCSATDALQLSNVTFRLYNITGELFNITTETATNNTHELIVNLSLENGTYLWNCEAYDNKSNTNSSTNYTLKVGAISINLNYPSNNNYTEVNSVDFNCSMEDSVSNLTNVTFYLWNSSSNELLYNKTEDISGTSNSSEFNYTFSNESSYEWNCEAYDEDSNSITESNNYSITYDDTNPVVTLVSPEDGSSDDAGSVSFSFNVTDDNEIDNCSLIVDGDMEKDDSSIDKDETESMTISLSTGSYDWKVQCRDLAGNAGTSSTWEISITSSSSGDDDDGDDGGGSGSTGGSSAGGTAFFISESDFKKGSSKYMRKGDIMKFNSSGESHELKVDSYNENSVKVIISSDPITLTISVGEVQKVDLNNDNVYDIEVQYLQYINTLAKLQIKEISEAIPTRTIQDDVPEITPEESNETIGIEENITDINATSFDFIGKVKGLWTDMGKTGRLIFYIVIGFILIVVIGILIHYNKERILSKIPRVDISLKKRRMKK